VFVAIQLIISERTQDEFIAVNSQTTTSKFYKCM